MFWFYLWFYKTKTALIISAVFVCLVELEGFEPSSKQGTQELSTCLSFG